MRRFSIAESQAGIRNSGSGGKRRGCQGNSDRVPNRHPRPALSSSTCRSTTVSAICSHSASKIEQGEKAHIGRVVPLVRQVFRHRHAPVQNRAQVFPQAKLGKETTASRPTRASRAGCPRYGAPFAECATARRGQKIDRRNRANRLPGCLDDADAIADGRQHIALVDLHPQPTTCRLSIRWRNSAPLPQPRSARGGPA